MHRSDIELLVEWSDETKAHKLSVVTDPIARDLLSRLLTKDPAQRPALSDILTHDYFKQSELRSLKSNPTNNNLLANYDSFEQVYDFYISYRDVDPDNSIVEEIYMALTNAGYKVSLGLRDDLELAARLTSDTERCNIIFKKIFI
jgi:serine/threonine protein kinase